MIKFKILNACKPVNNISKYFFPDAGNILENLDLSG